MYKRQVIMEEIENIEGDIEEEAIYTTEAERIMDTPDEPEEGLISWPNRQIRTNLIPIEITLLDQSRNTTAILDTGCRHSYISVRAAIMKGVNQTIMSENGMTVLDQPRVYTPRPGDYINVDIQVGSFTRQVPFKVLHCNTAMYIGLYDAIHLGVKVQTRTSWTKEEEDRLRAEDSEDEEYYPTIQGFKPFRDDPRDRTEGLDKDAYLCTQRPELVLYDIPRQANVHMYVCLCVRS